MNDLPFQIWLGVMFFFGSAIGGWFSGILTSARLASRIVESHMPKSPEFIAVRDINLQAVTTIEDGDIKVRCSIDTSASEMSSILVERWLASRDLMMVPKGKDFQVKASPKGGVNARD